MAGKPLSPEDWLEDIEKYLFRDISYLNEELSETFSGWYIYF